MAEQRSSQRAVSRRGYLRTAAAGVTLTGLGGASFSRRAAANPITAENRKDGDDGWEPVVESNARPEAVTHRIEGYTTETSFAPGDTVPLKVSTDPASPYRIDIYRLGWYDGRGGRIVRSLPGCAGEPQPIPEPDFERGLVECDWETTDEFELSKKATSGQYLVKFTLTGGEYEGEFTVHPFVVRPREDRGRTSKILFQTPIATSQAYNGWGGKSLYAFASTDDETANGTKSADAVSFSRPLAGATSLHLNYAIHALRFLEREGYDIAYVTDVDVHRDPEMVGEYDLAISAGHDEYWSMAQREGFEAARDSGTNIMFLAANTALWQVRYEDDERTMVCYKHNPEDDPRSGTQDVTALFRGLPDPRPECELLGVMGTGAGLYKAPDYSVVDEALSHPWMRGTGFEAGDEVVGCVGHEWDFVHDDCEVPGELQKFFHYEGGTSEFEDIGRDTDADAVAYQAPSGAYVFSTGTLGYTWRLDPDPSWEAINWPLSRIKEYKPEVLTSDERLQRFTRNALDDLRKPNPNVE